METIRIKVTHPINDQFYNLQAGEVRDVPEIQARIWIEQGWAVEIGTEKAAPKRKVKRAYRKNS